MLKELTICIIIITGILGLELFTQNFTSKTVNEITNQFNNLKKNISKQEIEQINKNIDNIWNKWEQEQKKLAFYIEHDELEKVHSAIVKAKSYIKTENFSEAMAELEEGKFVIEHIQEKNSFNLQNIF